MLESEKLAILKAERQRVARLGGLGRAGSLSARERKRIATKASKAAAKARTLKAKTRKAALRPQGNL